MIIGVDHGYSVMKTAHICFPSGIVRYEHEPYTNRGVLKIEGKYYVCGTGRQPLLRTKTENEQYYLLSHRKSDSGRLPGKRRWCWPLASRLPVSDGKRKIFGITCWKEKIR